MNNNSKLNYVNTLIKKPELELEKELAQLSEKKQKSNVISINKNQDKDDSTELSYAKSVFADENLVASKRGEHSSLYKWQGNYYKQLTKQEGKELAFAWLEKQAPDKARDSMAEECRKTALLKAKKLPDRPTDNYIPLRDGWLMVGDFGGYLNIAPDRNIGITYLVNADLNTDNTLYKPEAQKKNSYFTNFLNKSLPDKEVQSLLQEFCGSTLLGDTRFQKAIVNIGEGSNGKSVFLEIISALHEKISSMRLDHLEGFGLSNLIDTSLAIAAEAPKKGLNEEILKACITGDMVSVEGKFKDIIDYKPTAKWVIACNRFPKIQDESNGLWRRLFIIEWKVVIEEGSADQIRNLSQKIISNELKDVLDWCLEGLTRLMLRGKFAPPKSVLLSTEREKTENNNVISFVEDTFLEISPTETTKKDLIYNRYKDYCDKKSLLPYGQQMFWKRIVSIFGQDKLVYPRKICKERIEGSNKEENIQKCFVNLAYKN